jgi:hypothetical protein
MKQSFHVGQLVRLVPSSPSSTDTRIYCIVSQITATDDGKPAFRVKNASGRERLVHPEEIEPASLSALPS